jgi:hypothetical protein
MSVITDEIRNIRSGRRDLRSFGITMCICLAVLAALLFWRGKGTYVYFLALSPVFLVLGLAAPVVLRPVHKSWMCLAVLLSWVMTRVLLSLLFYIGVTPISLLGRLFGREFLDLAIKDGEDSYWVHREKRGEDRTRYEKQY